MNSLAILLFVLVVHLSNGATVTRTEVVTACPSVAEVAAEAASTRDATHWGASCGQFVLVPLPGRGA